VVQLFAAVYFDFDPVTQHSIIKVAVKKKKYQATFFLLHVLSLRGIYIGRCNIDNTAIYWINLLFIKKLKIIIPMQLFPHSRTLIQNPDFFPRPFFYPLVQLTQKN
jgi:hypothetical protein